MIEGLTFPNEYLLRFTRFRWVECQLRSLQSCPCSPAHLDSLLRSLPKSLDETYERMLCTIPSYLVGDARRILTMLCFADRPLKVRELIDAVAVEIKEPMGLRKDRRMQDYNDIHDICPGFIELNAHVDESDDGYETDFDIKEYVQIAHFSVQEYLVSDRIRGDKAAVFSLDSATANAEIAQVCLVYLLEPDLSTLLCGEHNLKSEEDSHNRDEESLSKDGESLKRDKESHDRDEKRGDLTLNNLLESYPLAKFAAESWPQQYKAMTDYSLEVHCLISKLLLQNGTNINWLSLHDKNTMYPSVLKDMEKLFEKAASPVYYASLLGLYDNLHEWFDGCHMRNQDDQFKGPYSMPKLLEMINAEGGCDGYPLVAASAFGRLTTVQMLLDKEANVNVCGENGTALYAASRA